jgi:hypothetical protein
MSHCFTRLVPTMVPSFLLSTGIYIQMIATTDKQLLYFSTVYCKKKLGK